MPRCWYRLGIPFILCCFLLGSCHTLPKPASKPSYIVPFEYLNNFIVIEAKINGFVPMNLIFDTGAQFSLLLDPMLTQLAGIQLERRFPIIGSDRSQILEAYRTNLVEISLGNIPTIKRKIMYLSGSDFDLSKYTSKEIHGILGSDILLNTLFRINYKDKLIEFYSYKTFIRPEGYETLSLFQQTARPELPVTVYDLKQDSIQLRLLMDTGASTSMILHENEDKGLTIPQNVIPTRIADGLGGQIEGFMARSEGIRIGSQFLNDFIFHFQSSALHVSTDSVSAILRDGLLGNQILDNFDIYYDMAFKHIHFYPYKRTTNVGQNENTTGILLVMGGEDFTVPIIEQVLPYSPAAKAGIEAGWEIKAINGIPSIIMPNNNIFKKMRGKPGRRLKLKLEKDGVQRRVSFRTAKLLSR